MIKSSSFYRILSVILIVLVLNLYLDVSHVQAENNSRVSLPEISEPTQQEVGEIREWVGETTDFSKVNAELSKYSKSLLIEQNKPKFSKVVDATGSYYLASYPIKAAEKESHFTLRFDKTGRSVENLLFLGIKVASNNIRTIIIRNGKVALDGNFDLKGNVISGQVTDPSGNKKELKQMADMRFPWACMQNCLAAQGIAMWAISVAGIACGALCATGAGCLVCLGAGSLGLGAAAGGCV